MKCKARQSVIHLFFQNIIKFTPLEFLTAKVLRIVSENNANSLSSKLVESNLVCLFLDSRYIHPKISKV